MWVVLIPTFERAKQTTLDFLIKINFPKERIIVSTQTEKDFSDLKQKYADNANIVFSSADNVAKNRNTAMKRARKLGFSKFLFLDDDIKRICISRGKCLTPKTITTRTDFENLVDFLFSKTEFLCGSVFGIRNVDNCFLGTLKTTIQDFCKGTMFGIIDSGDNFDENLPIKEDVEFCLRKINKGSVVVKFNEVFLVASHKTKGGCYSSWNKDILCTNMVLSKYKNIIKASKNKMGVSMARRPQTIFENLINGK